MDKVRCCQAEDWRKEMLFNVLLAQQIEEERRKDALREAEQARLMRVGRGPQGVRGRPVQVAAVLGNLVGFLTR